MATTTAGTMPQTRQQLDEIDTLLRRMLALPPLVGETPPAAPPPPSSYAPPHIRETPPAVAPAPGDPVVQSWRVEWPAAAAPVAPPPPSVVSWGAAVAAPAPPAAPPYAVSMPHVQQSAPPPVQGPTFVDQPPPSQLAPPLPGHLWPAVGVNWVFDALSYLLGPVGSWMRGSGRPTLGWVGVLLLLAAAGWAVGEWTGVEWPKWDVAKLLRFERGG